MIHTLWHSFRLWTSGIILIGLLLIATQCSPTATPIAQETPPVDLPPEITGFALNPPSPVLPGDRIGIQVKVNRNGHDINYHRWVVGVGEGSIISGQGTPLITYEAPETPGIYEVCVELEYEGGSVKGSTTVEVVSEPTPMPTEEPTAEPTEEPTAEPTEEPTAEPTEEPTEEPTPKPDAVVNVEALNLRSGPGVVYDILEVLKRGDCLKIKCKCPDDKWLEVTCPSKELEGWVAASLLEINLPLAGVPVAQVIPPTPTPMHTPIPTATPTPDLLPPPIPLEPENGASFLGEPPTLKWKLADDRPLGPDEVFSVRVRREWETELCHHDKADKLEYKASLSYCTAGTHYWSVALVRDIAPWLSEEDLNRWQNLSKPSEERWFYYVPSEEPWTWPTPESGGGESGGGTGDSPRPP